MNAMTMPTPHPKQGICDHCGCWDGHLVGGIGSCCAERLQKTATPPRMQRSWCFNEEQLNNALVKHHTAAAVACGLTKEQTQGCMQIVLTFLNSPETRKLRVETPVKEVSRAA